MDEALAMHLGPVLEEVGLEPDGVNIVEEYLKRRGWNEKAPNKTYMQALRGSVMSLYEVNEVVPATLVS